VGKVECSGKARLRTGELGGGAEVVQRQQAGGRAAARRLAMQNALNYVLVASDWRTRRRTCRRTCKQTAEKN